MAVGGQMGSKENKVSLLWAASTAATNVTNDRLKKSTVPLQTTSFACEPSERKSKETAAVLVSCSQNYWLPGKISLPSFLRQ